jgi:hypothetical protein
MSKLINNFNRGKSTSSIRATTYYRLKKLPKVNFRPIGENFPNLVTLSEDDRAVNQSKKTNSKQKLQKIFRFILIKAKVIKDLTIYFN